ncbi:MAG: DNA polymerase I [Candidatus Shikimatogenerans bostrichidophilus]|nr:MAG: DNA polymerase I [Candidatus Shikimatogenerans bostrichidophilus]
MKLITDKRLFIIDSFIYIYKYYYYYYKYYKKNSILIGFINFIINILIKQQPTYIIVIFDGKIKKNYKKKYYINYKLNRKKINIDLDNYIYIIKKILKKLNIQYLMIKYIEADDIIGSIIKKTEKKGYINYIYTEDQDYYQLISENTLLIKKNKLIDKLYVKNKFNIKNIKQYIDLISLIGDKSDNIPGIPLIGIKTANVLLIKYKNIENIYKNIETINNIIKKKIIYYKYLVFLSKKIIKINKKINFNFVIKYRNKIFYKTINNILLKLNNYFFKKKRKLIKNYLYL